MAERLSNLIDSLRAAAEPTRLRLLAICSEGELTVSEITSIVGQSQPRVSRHLKLLCNAGLLMRFREGHFVLYRVPATGESAAMVQQLLGQLSQTDEQLEIDSARMEIVKKDRARRAADYVRSGNGKDVRDSTYEDSNLTNTIAKVLGTGRIGDLLDIGTGSGRMLQLLAHHSISAVGIDTSPEMLTIARSNLHAAGLGRVMVRKGDMYGLPFPDESFDTVTVDHVLCRADDPIRVVHEASRVLRPQGRLLVVDFAQVSGNGTDSPGIGNEDLKAWLVSGGLRFVELMLLRRKPQNIVIALAVPVGSGDD